MQVMLNAIVSASVILMVGVGFALVFRTARFFHFAHGIFFTIGAYLAFLFKAILGLPLALSALLAAGGAACLGALVELAVYRPLRTKRASPLVLLLASLGVYVVLQNAVSLAFGDDTKSIRSGTVSEGFEVLGARITPIQATTVCASVVLVGVLVCLMRGTRFGKAMRAVADDPELARISGIASDRVLLLTVAAASALAGVAGVLVALDVDMTPTMGMNALMLSVVAVVVGGGRTITGVMLGAILLGFAQHLAAWTLGARWQEATALLVLLAFLLVKPHGFLGATAAKASV